MLVEMGRKRGFERDEIIKSLGLGDWVNKEERDKDKVQVSGLLTWVGGGTVSWDSSAERNRFKERAGKFNFGYDEFEVLTIYPGR